jgi:hypothetical protein
MAKVRDEAINEVEVEGNARNTESNARIDDWASNNELPNATESWMGPWERQLGEDLAALTLTMDGGNRMQADMRGTKIGEELRVERECRS